jgi:MFS family permease
MLGPFICGFFVGHLTWRWIFFVNAPIGAVAFVLIGLAFNVPVARVAHRLDILGSVLLVGAVTTLSFVASTAGESYSWGSPVVIGATLGGVILAVLLVAQERRAAEPVFPFRLFRDRIVTVCTATTFFIGAANFGLAVFLPIYLQVVTGASATVAGLSLMPVSAGNVVASISTGRTIARTGKYRWYPVIGIAVFTTGLYLLSTMDQDTSRWTVWSYTFIIGAGSGIASPVLMLAMQNAVGYKDLGVVSSLNQFGRTIGQVFGPAFGATLMAARFEGYLDRYVDPGVRSTLDGKDLRTETKGIEALAEPVRSQVIHAFRLAVADSFRLAVACSLVGLVIALFMRTRPLRDSVRAGETEHAELVSEW